MPAFADAAFPAGLAAAAAFFTAVALAAAKAILFAVAALRFARVLLLFAVVMPMALLPIRRVALFVDMLVGDLAQSRSDARARDDRARQDNSSSI